MMIKETMLAALRNARERWRRRNEDWHCLNLDYRMRRELGLPPRHPLHDDPRGPGWFSPQGRRARHRIAAHFIEDALQ